MFGKDKKARKVDEVIDDDFDLDTGLDMDDFDFNADPMQDDRKPVTKVMDGFLTGVKTGVQDTSFLKKTMKDILPEGYGQTMDLTDKLADSAKTFYDDTAKEIKPAIKDFKRITTKLIPPDAKFVPAPVQKMLEQWRQDKEDEKAATPLTGDQQREQFLSMQMADIFAAQSEEKQSERKEDDVKEAVDRNIDLNQHRDILGVVGEINASLARLDQYNRTATLGYQKKTLELMYRQLFALQDLVKLGDKDSAVMASELPSIKKNTALPEFVKQTNTEFLAEFNKRRIVESIGKNLFGGGAEYLDKVLGNFRKNMGDKLKAGLSEFRDGMLQAESAKDMMDDMGVDKHTMMGTGVGTAAGQGLATRAGKWAKENVLDKNEKVKNLGTKLGSFSENAPQHFNDWRQKAVNTQETGMKGWLLRTLGDLTNPGNVDSQMVDRADYKGLNDANTFGFTKRSDRTLNEVIPGYLARILREVQIFRTGQDVELTEYDHTKGDFSSSTELKKTVLDKVYKKDAAEKLNQNVDELINQLDPEEKLSPAARKALRTRLAKNSSKKQLGNVDYLGKASKYEIAEGSEEAAEQVTQTLGKMTLEQKAAFEKKHNRLLEAIENPADEIRAFSDLGYGNILKKAGALEQDGQSISRDKILDHYLGMAQTPPATTGTGGLNPPTNPLGGSGGSPLVPPVPSGGPASTPPTAPASSPIQPTPAPTTGGQTPNAGQAGQAAPQAPGAPPTQAQQVDKLKETVGAGIGHAGKWIRKKAAKVAKAAGATTTANLLSEQPAQLPKLDEAAQAQTDTGVMDQVSSSLAKGMDSLINGIFSVGEKAVQLATDEKARKEFFAPSVNTLLTEGRIDTKAVTADVGKVKTKVKDKVKAVQEDLAYLDAKGQLTTGHLVAKGVKRGRKTLEDIKSNDTVKAITGAIEQAPQALRESSMGQLVSAVTDDVKQNKKAQKLAERVSKASTGAKKQLSDLGQRTLKTVNTHIDENESLHTLREHGKDLVDKTTLSKKQVSELVNAIVVDGEVDPAKLDELLKTLPQKYQPQIDKAIASGKAKAKKVQDSASSALKKIKTAGQETSALETQPLPQEVDVPVLEAKPETVDSVQAVKEKADQSEQLPTGDKLPALKAAEDTPPVVKKYAQGGVFTNTILEKPVQFLMRQGQAIHKAVGGEAGPEAIMPVSEGGVQALTPTGDVAGILPVAKDAKGRLSVVTPSAPQSAEAVKTEPVKAKPSLLTQARAAVQKTVDKANQAMAYKPQPESGPHYPGNIAIEDYPGYVNKQFKQAEQQRESAQPPVDPVKTIFSFVNSVAKLAKTAVVEKAAQAKSAIETKAPEYLDRIDPEQRIKQKWQETKKTVTQSDAYARAEEMSEQVKEKATPVVKSGKAYVDTQVSRLKSSDMVKAIARAVSQTFDKQQAQALPDQPAAQAIENAQVTQAVKPGADSQIKTTQPQSALEFVKSIAATARAVTKETLLKADVLAKEKLPGYSQIRQKLSAAEDKEPATIEEQLERIIETLDGSQDHLKAIRARLNKGFPSGKKKGWGWFGRGKDQTEEGGEEEEQAPQHGKGISGLVGRAASGATSLTGKLLGGVGGTFMRTARMNFSALNWGGTKLGNFMTRPMDVYVEGEDKPRLYATGMKSGIYIKKHSKKTLDHQKGLDEPILDQDGNELISQEDLNKVYTKTISGRLVKLVVKSGKGLFGMLKKAAGAYANLLPKVFGFQGQMLSGAVDLAKKAVRGVGKLLDAPTDIYTPGEKDPILLAAVMKGGGYLSKATGKPVYRPSEIDGPLVDRDGNVVLSLETMRKGLTNAKGQKIKPPVQKLLGMVTGSVKGAVSGIFNAQKAAWGLTKKIAGGMAKGLKGFANGTLGGFSLEMGSAKTVTVLEEIRDMLKKKFVDGDKKVFGDEDGDGTKENSWQDLKKKAKLRMAQAKDKAKAGLGNAKDAAKKPAATAGDMLSGLGGLMGKVGGLVEGVKGIFSLGKGGVGMVGKAAGLLGSLGGVGKLALGLIPGLGGAATAAASTAAGALATGGATAAAGTTLAGGATAAAGGGILSAVAGTIGAAGAGLMSFLASPVVIGVGAAALAGYGAYKLYNYFKDKMVPLDKVRLVQYGFQKDDKKAYGQIKDLEKTLQPQLSIKDGTAAIDESSLKVKDLLSIFDLDEGKQADVELFFKWYQERFKPVYLTHVSVVHRLKKKLGLTSVGDLVKEDALSYLEGVKFPEGPYNKASLPGKDSQYKATGASDVVAVIEELKKELGLDKIKPKDDKGSSGVAVSTAAVAAAGAVTSALPAKKPEAGAEATKPEAAKKTAGFFSMETLKSGGFGLTALAGKAWGAIKKTVPGMAGVIEGTIASIPSILKYTSLPVLLAATVLGGHFKNAVTSVVKFVKGLFGQTFDSIDKIRLVQYGFQAGDETNFAKIRKIEEYCKGFIAYGNGSIRLDDSQIEVKKLLEPFGLDATNTVDLELFFKWYQDRFKPIFLTHSAAVAQMKSTGKPDLSMVQSFKKEELATYVKAIEFPEGPYDKASLPLKGKHTVTNAKDVKTIIASVKRELGLDKIKAGDIKNSMGDVQKPLAKYEEQGEFTPNADIAKNAVNDKAPVSALAGKKVAAVAAGTVVGVNKAFEADNLDAREEKATVSALADLATLKPDGKLLALDAIKFKVYGLRELDQDKIKAIQAVEKAVFSEIKYSNGEATWSGTIQTVLQKVMGLFGITESVCAQANKWTQWFLGRFLPTYLQYCMRYSAMTGTKGAEPNSSLLKVSQQLDLARQLAALGMWSKDSSPFPNYKLGTESSAVEENLAFLEAIVKQEKALEDKRAVRQAANKESQSNVVADSANKPAMTDNGEKGALEGKTANAKATGVQAESPDAEPKPTASATKLPMDSKLNPSSLRLAEGPVLDGRNGYNLLNQASGVKLDEINPAMAKQVYGMVEEYHQLTGKKPTVTDGYRSYADQVKMKEKYGDRAATPGKSLHGFGLAMDMDSKALNEMDDLGLMRKYGMTRPLGGEPWHMEPIGIQLDTDLYKKDEGLAIQVIEEGLGRGGGGMGTVKGAPLNNRSRDLSQKILESKITPNVKTAGVDANKKAMAAGNYDEVLNPKQDETLPAPTGSSLKPGSDKSVKEVTQPKTVSPMAQHEGEPSPSQAAISQVKTAAGRSDTGSAMGADKKELPADPTIKLPEPITGNVQSVRKTVEAAAKMVGVNPEIAVSTVAIESGFNPEAKAKTSSASGLYQFTNSTWQETVGKHGSQYGISPGTVSPFDAKANALMGAHYIKDNSKLLASRTGDSDINGTDIYAAHFLGAGGASKFIKAYNSNPEQSAPALMPAAAASNTPIFFNDGRPRSVGQVYDLLDHKVKTKSAQFGIVTSDAAGSTKQAPPAPAEASVTSGVTGKPMSKPQPEENQAQSTPKMRYNAYGEAIKDEPKQPYADEAANDSKASNPVEVSKAVQSLGEIGRSPMDEAFGFNPKSIDTNARQQTNSSNLMGADLFKTTEALLGQSVQTQEAMLGVLRDIFGIMHTSKEEQAEERKQLDKEAKKASNQSGSRAQRDAQEASDGGTGDALKSASSSATHSLPKSPISMKRYV